MDSTALANSKGLTDSTASKDLANSIGIYCVSFDNSERKKRMVDRFTQLGLIDLVTFQEPINPESPLIEYYLRKREERKTLDGKRACSGTISYLEMIKSFIISGKSYGIFCEDDVHIRKSIKEDTFRIISAIEKLRILPKVVLLGYLIHMNPRNMGYSLYENTTNCIIDNTFYLMNYPQDLWGSQMILLSREGAMDILEQFDRPIHLSCPGSAYGTDWTVTKVEPRLLVYPMLGVEEGNVGCNHQGQINFHHECHKYNFNPDKYI